MSLFPPSHRQSGVRARSLFALCGALLAGACQSGPTDGGSAVAAVQSVPPGPTISYRLATTDPTAGADVVQHREIVASVQAALAAQGMREVARGAVADLVVSLEYRVGPPHNGQISENEAVFEITPGGVHEEAVPVGLGSTGSTIYEMRKVKEPDIKIYAGEHAVTVTRRVYEKRLRLSARANDLRASGGLGREAWSVELIAEGQRRDFRKMLPVLAGAARPFLGHEADGAAVLRINDDSGEVESVERAL